MLECIAAFHRRALNPRVSRSGLGSNTYLTGEPEEADAPDIVHLTYYATRLCTYFRSSHILLLGEIKETINDSQSTKRRINDLATAFGIPVRLRTVAGVRRWSDGIKYNGPRAFTVGE